MSHQHQNLDVLIQRIQEQDTTAYDVFMHAIEPLLNTAVSDTMIAIDDREDVKQDIRIRLYRVIPHFDTTRDIPFIHYMNRMIKMVKVDYRRRRAQRVTKETMYMRATTAQYETAAYDIHGLEASFVLAEITRKIHGVFPKLSAFEQRVLTLLLQDSKPQEIARCCGVSEKNVYNALYRIKVKLKRYLQHMYNAHISTETRVHKRKNRANNKLRKIDN